jgi:tripartite-type tricarboxylate transporter receptor subunit TctC
MNLITFRASAFILMAGLVMAAPASAQTRDATAKYPSHPVRFVVPYSAGGGTDVVMRLVAKHMAEAWNVPVVVENRVGAGGIVGSQHIAGQKPDGRNFLAVASAFGVRVAIDRSVPFDAIRDFSGVGQLARSPSFLVVSPQHGFKSLRDLIAFAKAQPVGVFYSTAGVGSTAHLHAAAVAYLTGIKAEHVPQRGTPEAVTEAMTGRVLYAFAPGPNAIPLAKAGKLQVLVTTSSAGSRMLPGVPTFKEAGLDYEGDDWFGVLAPAGTPVALRQQVSSEMGRILALPELRERLGSLGMEPQHSAPAAFENMLKDYISRARKLADAIGMKVE